MENEVDKCRYIIVSPTGAGVEDVEKCLNTGYTLVKSWVVADKVHHLFLSANAQTDYYEG